MHSCDELLESINDALYREDAEALYIEISLIIICVRNGISREWKVLILV